jgi:hypothetical protein
MTININYEHLEEKDINTLKSIGNFQSRLKKYFRIVRNYRNNLKAHYEMIMLVKKIHNLRTKKGTPDYNDLKNIQVLDDKYTGIYFEFCNYLTRHYHDNICDPVLEKLESGNGTESQREKKAIKYISDTYDDEKTDNIEDLELNNYYLREHLENLEMCIEIRELWPRLCDRRKILLKKKEQVPLTPKVNFEKESHYMTIDSIKRIVKHILKLIDKNEKRIKTLYSNELKESREITRQIQKDLDEEMKKYKEKEMKEEQEEQSKPSTKSKNPTSKNKKSDSDVNKCNNKICPDGKICNPKTGRCVDIHGSIGKLLLQNDINKCLGKPPCEEGFICNPASGRCVKKDGKIGKSLL